MFPIEAQRRLVPKWQIFVLGYTLAMALLGLFQLVPLTEGSVYEPFVRGCLPLLAILPLAFIVEHLFRTWVVSFRSKLLIARRGIFGKLLVVDAAKIASAQLDDNPPRVTLVDRNGGHVVSIGPWDLEHFWGATRVYRVCDALVGLVNGPHVKRDGK